MKYSIEKIDGNDEITINFIEKGYEAISDFVLLSSTRYVVEVINKIKLILENNIDKFEEHYNYTYLLIDKDYCYCEIDLPGSQYDSKIRTIDMLNVLTEYIYKYIEVNNIEPERYNLKK